MAHMKSSRAAKAALAGLILLDEGHEQEDIVNHMSYSWGTNVPHDPEFSPKVPNPFLQKKSEVCYH